MKPIQQWTTADIIELLKGVDKGTWIRIGIGSAAAFILIYFLIWPAWVARPGIYKEIKAIETQIQTTNTLYRKKPELEKNRDEDMKYIQAQKTRLYLPGESSLLLGAISKKAEASKVSVIGSKPVDYLEKFPVPFDAQYEGSAYIFTLEGGYHDLGGFISKIETNEKLLRIQSFHLQPQNDNPQKHVADLSLSAVSIKKDKPQ